MRGASALQALLDELGQRPLHVFIVWEPVVATDLAPPTSAVLARASDPRVSQYWDRSKALSKSLQRAAADAWRGFPIAGDLREAGVVWDYVLVFPTGGEWSDAGPPTPDFAGGTVVDTIAETKAHLESLAN